MMDFTWLMVGILTAAAVVTIHLTTQRYRLRWQEMTGLIGGACLLLFSIPWAVASILEGVPRAASMGILLFAIPGLVLLAFTWRSVVRQPLKVADVRRTPAPISPFPTTQPKPSQSIQKTRWSRPVAYLAYVTLALAFVAGILTTKTDYTEELKASFPDAEVTSLASNPPVFKLEFPEGGTKYATTGDGHGYGGPLVIAVLVNEDGAIEKLGLLSNQETPSYRKKVADAEFAAQFLGRKATENFIVGQDIDAVSGATVSCVAGADAIREGAHRIATTHLGMPLSWTGQPWAFDLKNLLIVILFGLAFWSWLFKNKWRRYIFFGASLAIIGFYANACISIASLGAIPLGYFPPLRANPVWWILTMGTLITIIVLAKNIWCYKLCPFYAMQFFLNKVSGTRIKLPPYISAHAPRTASFLLWLSLLTIVLTRNPALGSFEPFSMAFSLNGEGLQWFLLPASIIGAFFIPTFWCRYFCPLGHGLNKIVSLRKIILNKRPRTQEG